MPEPIKQYCSIDLEFTGFNPDEDQILEIGFAFFSITDQGIKIGEQWSQVFRPTIEVHEKIFGLTGITPEELESAPDLSEYIDFLNTKLSNVTLVAHNPTLDVRFLEAAGVKLLGDVVDTLELVQFILPTHHSYNLENLAHYFDIKHQGSHRALSDCLTTIGLLENLLGIYQSFPEELKNDLLAVMERGQFSWREFFKFNIPVRKVLQRDTLQKSEPSLSLLKDLNAKIILDENHNGHEYRVITSLASQGAGNKHWVALPDSRMVMKLWQKGLGKGVFREFDLFDQLKFGRFLERAQTPEELRFCLKILVWLATNWQSECVLDLNLSFFGGQFKGAIIGGEQTLASDKFLISDYQTLLSLVERGKIQDKNLVVVGLQEFEEYLTSGAKTRLSWNGISFGLKSVYNPETGLGNSAASEIVLAALAATDLFFGLVQIILRRHMKSIYVTIDDLQITQPYFYARLRQASENLIAKLNQVRALEPDSILATKLEAFENFFSLESDVVKWISLQEENVVMQSQPVHIKPIAEKIYANFSSYQYTETLINQNSLLYLAERLGLNHELSDISPKAGQYLQSASVVELDESQKVYEHITSKQGAQVLVFLELAELKQFYKDYYQKLKNRGIVVLAQDYSGSGNKMFRNFSMFKNVVLLATSDFIAKQKYSISTDYLTFLSWPVLNLEHPYVVFLNNNYPELFQSYVTVYPELKFWQIAKKVAGKGVPELYFDSRVSTNVEI